LVDELERSLLGDGVRTTALREAETVPHAVKAVAGSLAGHHAIVRTTLERQVP
jgi:hypothetical protein